jgi:hypothetical protein
MAQTIDEAHCKFPDYYMYKVITCACGDTPVKIRGELAAMTVEAHWCTGSLKMLDGFGKITYVNNPYSHTILLGYLETLPAYLRCISQLADGVGNRWENCDTLKPKVPGIDDEQSLDVMSIAVLGRCRANFQQQQWDEGAYHKYELDYEKGIPRVPGSVGDCLVTAHTNSLSNTGCLQDYLNFHSMTKASYFAYENNVVLPAVVDACVVFTGPSTHENDIIREKFRNCINDPHQGIETTADHTWQCSSIDYTVGTTNIERCQIPPMVWSGGSKNNAPVASLHQVPPLPPPPPHPPHPHGPTVRCTRLPVQR